MSFCNEKDRSKVRLENLSKSFIKNDQIIEAVSDVTLDIKEGEIIVFVGPSGCGKSTILNLIAGFIQPTSGKVYYDGREVDGVASVKQKLGYMTQRDTMLPWRTILEDVMLPLEIQGVPKDAKLEKARKAIEMVRLSDFENHYPKELSGGMRKRVILARTLVYEPETLLMDEPFGSLDAQTKLVMQNELMEIWHKTEGKTIIFVTHDLGEAISLADRVVVFTGRPGRPKYIHSIDISRPRDVFKIRFSKVFADAYDLLWSYLEEEIQKGEEI